MPYKDPTRQREAMRRWGRENPRLEEKRKYNASYSRPPRDPVKAAAQGAIRNAVKRGDIRAEPCLFCDEPKTEAHHHDYSLPMAVTWLCRHHHKLIHRTSGA